MNNIELTSILGALSLTQADAAKYLSVNVRTVRRWMDGSAEIPGTAVQALLAWQRLQKLGVEWRPINLPIGEDDPDFADQVAGLRNHAIDLVAVLKRVEERGGPRAPWEVDLKSRRATLGNKMQVSFYKLANGGFSPASYSRTDQHPDRELDQPLLEDAFACIAKALGQKKIWPL